MRNFIMVMYNYPIMSCYSFYDLIYENLTTIYNHNVENKLKCFERV